MTDKGFGINIPGDYIPHPKTEDERNELVKEVRGYQRPQYASCKYLYTTFVDVKDIKLKKNAGRKRGNDGRVLDTVGKSLEKGYKLGKLPPVMLRKEGGDLENFLINGNHRWLWYSANGYKYMLVDVYEVSEGYDEGDVMDEVGLLWQPQPDGTSSNYDDYKARGLAWVKRQQEKGIDVTQEMIDEWVEMFAVHETALTRHNLKKNIFNVEVKDSFLTNYTRPQVVRFYSNCNLAILDGGAEVTTKIVDRLFEASQKVWLRDFLPTFFANAAKGIKTRLNFYVNTTNINTADEIETLINNRLDELDSIFDNLSSVYSDSEEDLREYLVLGSRPPQIVDTDCYDELIPIRNTKKVQEPVKYESVNLLELTYQILTQNFEVNEDFTAQQAYDAIRTYRFALSQFKSEKSYRGTILAELQALRDDGRIHFYPNQRGTYCLLR
ncbi:hypothetical protein CMO86_01115 [Candidatus Woesearchaeota archaeon]|jgi:hypothetical protein|nr:hypothetical protein [Candidatus Woesearchaeota archaeon]|tara:strand:- start:57 stop:1373 length:1317 start_codon:yes stop_codon:yes gene_type:complete